MGRLLPGPQDTVLQQSITGRMLVDMGLRDPDFMPTIMSLNPDVAPFMSFLDARGYKTKNVNMTSNWAIDGGRFKTVASNHVQFRIESDDWRFEHFRPNSDGVTFVDMANPDYPGLDKNPFYIYLDSNFAGGNEVILLADGKTQLYLVNKDGGKDKSGGVFEYEVKIDGNRKSDYVDVNLIQDGVACQVVTSKYRQDFSTGGNEKHFFGGFGDAYLTLQRFKISYSGTAAAMDKNTKISGRWVQPAGDYKQMAFITEAQQRMMKDAAKYVDFQLLEGKTTVDYTSKKVLLSDGEHQEVLSGNGALYSGDGPIEFPINNGWNKKFLEAFIRDIDSFIRTNDNGDREIMLMMHPTSYFNLQALLGDMNVTQNNNIIGDGDSKIINNTYKGYSLGGITLILVRSTALSRRPGLSLKDGTMSNEWDTIALPLGLSASGKNGYELIQLRPMSKGTVAGIDKGGQISNDIDGSTEHVLLQNGIISMNQAIKLYRPYQNNLV